jgi:hypothetical protein
MRTATQALRSTDDILVQLNNKLAAVEAEANAIQKEWLGLCKAGGGRDDHAAALLQRLLLPLAAIHDFAFNCMDEIDRLQTNPFGDE